MTSKQIISHDELKEEMKAVARGDQSAPGSENKVRFNSVAALTRLLTAENRELLAKVRDYEPQSIAELAEITGRAAPNLTRTLEKLEAAGLISIKQVGNRKVATAEVSKIHFEIDPYSNNDWLKVT